MGQAFQISIIFKKDWAQSLRAKDIDPCEALHAELQDALYFVQMTKKSGDGCVFQVVGADKDDVSDSLDTALDEIAAGDGVKFQQIKEIAALDTPAAEKGEGATQPTQGDSPQKTVQPAQGDTAQPVHSMPAREKPAKKKQSALEKIQQMIGADEFKAQAEELALLAPVFLRNDTWEMMAKRCYLFSLEDGCGVTTQCELFGQLLDELSLGQYAASGREFPASISLDSMLSHTADSPKLSFILFDVSAWLGKENQPEFRQFLRTLEQLQGRRIYAFRIPYVDKHTMHKMQDAISDIFMVQPITTPPYTIEQMHAFAEKEVSDAGFTLSDAAWQGMERHIMMEKSDGRFWGLNTMRKIIRAFLYEKQRATAISGDETNEKLLGEESIPAGFALPESSLSAREQLDALVGIEPIRTRLLEVVSQIEVAKRTPQLTSPCLHMRFVGNPGTGKTTVARILGQLLKEHGLLSKGKFFEVAGRDLCGEYVGETAPKTAAICRDAYGSVLFIDEAYSLYRGGNDKDYGREAIDTLIAQMENHKEDFVVIMAGYQEDMDTLLKSNIGLESRMPYTIAFPNYNRETLAQIFMRMAVQNFDCAPDLQPAVECYFAALNDTVLADARFANARFVRNLFERTWGKAAVRDQLEPAQAITLTASDFQQATTQGEFKALQEKKTTRTIGFMP